MASRALTAAAVERIKPPLKGQEDHFDRGYPGLALRISYGGSRSWVYFYRYDRGSGRKTPVRMTLGTWPAMDLKGAREAWREARGKVAAGRDPAADARAAKAAKSKPADLDRDLFENVARLFIERHAKPKNRSWRETARLLGLVEGDEGNLIVRGGVAAAWEGRRIQEITRRDVIELIDEIEDRAPVAAKNTFSAIRKLVNWCVARGVLEASPIIGAQAPAPPKARDRVLSDAELREVWKASDTLGHPFGPLVKILVLTGQRREEVAGMRWAEVDLEERLWTIPAGRMKRDRPQEVPLADPVVEILEGLRRLRIKGSPYVLTVTGTTPPSGFSRAKRRLDAALAEAQEPEAEPIPAWRLHDLRRTLASGVARLGIALPVIEKVLAHESGSFAGIVSVYQRHGYRDEKRHALETWTRFVMGLIEERPSNVVEMRDAAG